MRGQGDLRRSAALLGLVAALLGLSGCFTVSQDVNVRADGSGSVAIHVDMDKKAFAAAMGSFGGAGTNGATPVTAPFKVVNRTFPDGAKVRAADSVERSTMDASFDFEGPEDYSRKIREIDEAVATDGNATSNDGSLRTRRTGNRLEVQLDVGFSMAATSGVDLSALLAEFGGPAVAKVAITITMPGSILASNGQVNGRTVTWDPLRKGSPSIFTVTSSVDDTGLPAWVIPAAAGLGLLLLLVLAGAFLSSRRRPAAVVGPVSPAPWAASSHPATFFPNPSPGWYPDPAGGTGRRYWDGTTWTEYTA